MLSHKDLCQGTGFIDITGCMRLSIDLLGDINGLLPAVRFRFFSTIRSEKKSIQNSILSTCFQTASSYITFDILSQKKIFFKERKMINFAFFQDQSIKP